MPNNAPASNKWKQRLLCAVPYITPFAISFLIGLLFCAANQITPFGNKSFLAMDLWGEYFPMYLQNAEAQSFSELLFSWNGALGHNNLAQGAYYANSPFLLLLRFVPVASMVRLFDWLCLLKISLSATALYALLRHRLQKDSVLAVAGSVAYGFCGYMLAYISQFMWTDLLVFAPLVLLGLERLIFQQKPLAYTFTLAFTFLCNFYLGFCLCIFLVMYFAARWVTLLSVGLDQNRTRKPEGVKPFGSAFGQFAVYSLLAGLMAVVVILPTMLAIGETALRGSEFPQEIKWYDQTVQYLQYLLPAQKLKLGYDGANLYTGFLVFLLVPIYFLNKSVHLGERIVTAFALLFMTLSMNSNLLDYMWHGMRFPNQLPVRWSFLFSLWLTLICVIGLCRHKGLTPARTVVGLALGWLGVIWVSRGWPLDAKHLTELLQGQAKNNVVTLSETYWLLLVGGSLLLLVAAFGRSLAGALSAKKEKQALKRAAAVCVTLLAVVWILDSGCNFIYVSRLPEGGLPAADEVGYTQGLVRHQTAGAKWQSDETDFYRVEPNGGFTFNPSMLGGYRGVGYYSSTMNGKTYSLLRAMGNRVYANKISCVYKLDSVVQNSLFGVRYYLDFNRNLNTVLPLASLVEQGTEVDVYENPTALPLAYGVSDAALGYQPPDADQVQGIYEQDRYLDTLCGKDMGVYTPIARQSFVVENATLPTNDAWSSNYYHRTDATKPAVFRYVYVCPQDGPVYLEQNFFHGKMTVNGAKLSIDPGLERFRYLGNFAKGDQITVEQTISANDYGAGGVNLYHFNQDAWQAAYAMLAANGLDVTRFKNTEIQGKVHMANAGLLMTTVMQDGGWSVYCDGQKMETTTAGGGLLAVRLPAGDHEITLRYGLPGFVPGLIVSLLAFAAALLVGSKRVRQGVHGCYCQVTKKAWPVKRNHKKVQTDAIEQHDLNP